MAASATLWPLCLEVFLRRHALEITQRSLEIGPFDIFGLTLNPTIHWYGVIIVIGILAATSLVAWLAKKDEDDPDIVWNGVIWVVILAVLGARFWSVAFPAGNDGTGRTWNLDYITDLSNGPLAIWSGGLSIFGAIVGGLLGVIVYARRHKLKILPWADRIAIALPLGQAIGRWGNYVNQELYGRPTDLPWGIKIDTPLPQYANETHFHPLFLYESICSLILCAVLFTLWRKRREIFQHADFLLMYMAGYGAVRFLLEFIRVEIPTVGSLNVSQLTTGVMFVVAVWLLVMRHGAGRFTTEKYPPFGQALVKKKGKKAKAEKSPRPA